MKFFKKIKISEMSVPCAMLLSGILSGLIIGLSIFLTTLVFFGGDNNRQKLSVKNPLVNNVNRNMPTNTLTPEQIRQMQEAQKQRAMQQKTNTATNTEPVQQ